MATKKTKKGRSRGKQAEANPDVVPTTENTQVETTTHVKTTTTETTQVAEAISNLHMTEGTLAQAQVSEETVTVKVDQETSVTSEVIEETCTAQVDEEAAGPNDSSAEGLVEVNDSPASTTDTEQLPTIAAAPLLVQSKSSKYSEKDRKTFFDAPWKCPATQVCPLMHKLLRGEPVAFDAEFQNFKHADGLKWKHRIGCVALVNTAGEAILHVYAAYPREENVRKMVSRKGGVDVFNMDHRDLRFKNGAVEAHTVEKWVAEILKGRHVIVHGGRGDLCSLMYEQDAFENSTGVIDTQNVYSYLQPKDGTPSLKNTAEAILDIIIQEQGHTAVEDAAATVQLYLKKDPYDREAEEKRIRHEAPETLVKPVDPESYPSYARYLREQRGEGRKTKVVSKTNVSRHVTIQSRSEVKAPKVEVEEIKSSVNDLEAFPAFGKVPAKTYPVAGPWAPKW
jgi:hypothetical protein